MRVRANPQALAGLTICLASLVLGVGILKVWGGGDLPGALAGALIGAAASALSGLSAYFLGTPKDLPRVFYEAARQDFAKTRYYKRQLAFKIKLKDQKLCVQFTSVIMATSESASIQVPGVGPPKGATCGRIAKERYDVDAAQYSGWDGTEIIPLRKGANDEFCRVVYELDPASLDRIIDDHRSSCPVDGLTIEADLPPGYEFKASALMGDRRTAIPQLTSRDGIRRFRLDGGWFSEQGFVWEIVRPNQASNA
jgi:hypothetical protein